MCIKCNSHGLVRVIHAISPHGHTKIEETTAKTRKLSINWQAKSVTPNALGTFPIQQNKRVNFYRRFRKI